ncbi:MAG TPA: DUF3795 domain-containing protein [Anaerolineae bacterium]|nr:DUF3795 domain-containing protein [Anaerolineae bacterium]
MKAKVLTRCGYRCDLCLAYAPNVASDASRREKLSDGWLKFFGFRIPPERIVCDGCLAENPRLIDRSCPVRPCVIQKGLQNCASCEEYICDRLAERLVTYKGVRDSAAGLLSEDDYQCFVRPYENKRRLEALRATRNLERPTGQEETNE